MATSIENSSGDSDVLKQIGSAVGQPSPMSQSNSGASSEDPPAVSPLYAPWRRLRYESKCLVYFSCTLVLYWIPGKKKRDCKRKTVINYFPLHCNRFVCLFNFLSFSDDLFLDLIKACNLFMYLLFTGLFLLGLDPEKSISGEGLIDSAQADVVNRLCKPCRDKLPLIFTNFFFFFLFWPYFLATRQIKIHLHNISFPFSTFNTQSNLFLTYEIYFTSLSKKVSQI